MRSDPRWMAVCLLAACTPGRPGATAATLDPVCVTATGDSLVDIRSLAPDLRVDVRYATSDNFTGEPLPGYDAARVLLRPAAARALARIQAGLRPEGLGLKVWDGYRPVRATLAMVDWAERSGNAWVVEQGYVARESGHNRGHTVDLTLIRLRDGRELEMGTPYDHFADAAHTANATGSVAANRQRLVRAMAAEGFSNYEKEWWHFSSRAPGAPLDVTLACRS